MENSNSVEYLEKIKAAVIDNLRHTIAVPSVQMQDVPSRPFGAMTEEEEAELNDLDDDENQDERITQRRWDQRITHDNEFEPSDDEDMAHQMGGPANVNGTRRTFDDYRHSDMEVDSGPGSPTNGAAAEDLTADDEKGVEEVEEHNKTMASVERDADDDEPADEMSTHKVDADGDVGMDDTVEAETTTIKEEDVEHETAAKEAHQPEENTNEGAVADATDATDAANAAEDSPATLAPTAAREVPDSEDKAGASEAMDVEGASSHDTEDR
jgi:histone deacetylase 1/2